ncbi:unnamed protein product [Cylicostephanus goldi]|uniref:G-protein coupled receptors family 1 profile domain-containing protein n=1 Tax=Cylicostephanus goldi TaxID=71465 RepID=A0A3P7ND86_CYLGO|nr:unnamed protein product [Cylicostephanus goldi]
MKNIFYHKDSGDSEGTVPPLFVYIMYFIHALPFTNSAINWILYGALNGQLQQRYRGARLSTNTITTRTPAPCKQYEKPKMNGSTTFLSPPTDGMGSSGEHDADASEMVDVRLLTAHEPTYL